MREGHKGYVEEPSRGDVDMILQSVLQHHALARCCCCSVAAPVPGGDTKHSCRSECHEDLVFRSLSAMFQSFK